MSSLPKPLGQPWLPPIVARFWGLICDKPGVMLPLQNFLLNCQYPCLKLERSTCINFPYGVFLNDP